ncbi:hypothetical protein AJ79_05314 [Helicocarpus griseus UAMH5409]|uniref:Zn(2)-C6 fungal-type domain-containing protein n=1 Tax=Helicocarpus griseus UAMH5409 TaxID=1447875 RepID=A0A2B7XPN2_9EURO|nr:hypothetical protein AJ79_05314 [Helicocarpus griseus UAMH5409]
MDAGRSLSGPQAASTPSDIGKSKCRAKQSCIPCRTRKVKCDRIKPCQACCIRGLPSECEYVVNNEDRFLITQADAIASLRNEVAELKQQLAALGHVPCSELGTNDGGSIPTAALSQNNSQQFRFLPQPALANAVPYEKYAALEAIVNTIATAPPEVVAKTVAQVRTGTLLDSVGLSTGPQLDHSQNFYSEVSETPPISPEYVDTQSGAQADNEEYRQSKKSKARVKQELADTASTPEASVHSYPLAMRKESNQNLDAVPIKPASESNKITDTNEISSRSAQVGQKTSRKRERSVSPSINSISQRNFLIEGFLARLVDDFSPEVDGNTIGSSQVVRSAAGIRIFSPVLSDAFKAVSLTYFGQNVADQRIERTGYRVHVSVLRKLQEAINQMEKTNSQGVLLTVCLLMCFEAIQRTTAQSLISHTAGALRILEYRGPQNHMFGVDHLCFAELRPYWVCLGLITRKSTFLAKEEWKTTPFAAGSSTKDLMHYLLDHVVDIPAYLFQFDNFMARLNAGELSYDELAATQGMLWSWADDLDERLRQWKKDWVDSIPSRQPSEVTNQGSDPFPVFRCRDLRTMDIITPTTLVYPDLRIANTICMYYASRLVLSGSDTRPTDALQPPQQYELACNICRSMEYFIRHIPGKLVNRVAFPLRVAFDVLPELGVEREYVVDVFRLVNDRYKLKLWGTTIPEISSKRRL